MIRRNPNGDIPVVHETALVDPAAILCGKVVVEEKMFICTYADFGTVGDGSVVRHNAVVEGCSVSAVFYIPSITNIHSDAEQATIVPVTLDQKGFSE